MGSISQNAIENVNCADLPKLMGKKYGCRYKVIMRSNLIVSRNGTLQYNTGKGLDVNSFLLLMEDLAEKFSVNPEIIKMPEAEIVKIILGNGEIYARFDFAYGVGIECEGFYLDQKMTLEKVLLGY